MSLLPISKDLLFSRGDAKDPRLGEIVQISTLKNLPVAQTPGFAIIGYPDDDGIAANGGRLGAAQAPDVIRKFLYRMTPAEGRPLPLLFDLGNLETANTNLAERHQSAKLSVQTALEKKYRTLSLGGGHDYAYADTLAFAQVCRAQNLRPLVINFDAHLDVRDTSKGFNSGTPFFRLLSDFPEIDFLEVGIQSQCNSGEHYKWLRSKDGRVLTYDDILLSHKTLTENVNEALGEWWLKPRPVFLSVDIDGFSSAVAPGCSQSWATGLMPDEFFRLWQTLHKRLQVWGVGIYEVSPPLDVDNMTAKLAALILHRTLCAP